MDEELNEVKRLALRAGAILLDYFRGTTAVEWKSPGDPVTAADREANQLIVDELQKLFPDDGILSEELPDNARRLEKPRVWMIDPMDGTREFIAGREEFAVMIGLAVDGIPASGVVYQPVTGKLYYAAAGAGAFLDHDGRTRTLTVSPSGIAAEMTIAVSRSHRSARVESIAQTLRIARFVRTGSVGLKVGLICEGRAHLYIHAGNQIHLWDTCGPEAILREAGGRLTDAAGQPLRYTGRQLRNLHGVIASNGVIHDRAVTVTQQILAQR